MSRRPPAPQRWHRQGPLYVLRRWPSDVEVLAARLADPVSADEELRRVASKRSVSPADVQELRALCGSVA